MISTEASAETAPGPKSTFDEQLWSANLAMQLADLVRAGEGAAVTWYNHASVCRSIDAQVDAAEFDYVGVDGVFLRWLAAPEVPRTSADLVLPMLLNRLPGCRVALIGSDRRRLAAAVAALEALPSKPRVVFTADGYSELLPPARMAQQVQKSKAAVVVLGLGAPLQDEYLLELRRHGLGRQLLVTCGGWLDQVSQPEYYPSFAYRLKLNWLVRVLREPSRLWRRYTVEGVRAYRRRSQLREHLLVRGAAPLAAMVSACAVGSTVAPGSSARSSLAG